MQQPPMHFLGTWQLLKLFQLLTFLAAMLYFLPRRAMETLLQVSLAQLAQQGLAVEKITISAVLVLRLLI